MEVIRDYSIGDEHTVMQILQIALAVYGLSANPEETDLDISDIQKYYIDSGGVFRVLVDGSKVIGSYGLFPLDKSVCELRKMYIYPEYKGRGLGKRLMNDALVRARNLGFKKMVLETNSRLVEAIGMYKKLGFVEYFPAHMSDRCDYAMEIIL